MRAVENPFERILPQFCISETQEVGQSSWSANELKELVPAGLSMDSWAPARVAEFLAGRGCVRRALLRAGVEDPGPVGVGRDRAPVWPRGWTGSITHHRSGAFAAVTQDTRVLGIGIDAEDWMSVQTADEVSDQILTESEAARVQALDGAEERLKLITGYFSAKESIFKAVFSQVRRHFDFTAVEISDLSFNEGRFRYLILKDLAPGLLRGARGDGRILRSTKHVFTSVVLVRLEGSL